MGDHELPEPAAADEAPAAPVDRTIESKVITSSLVTLAAGCAVAVLNEVATNSALLGGLPAWAQALTLCLVPPILTFAGGYLTTSNRV